LLISAKFSTATPLLIKSFLALKSCKLTHSSMWEALLLRIFSLYVPL
jgi:hypothetical protein